MGRKNKSRRRNNRKPFKYQKGKDCPKGIKLNDVEITGSIDAHCWVERNGKIIDPHFPDYNKIAKVRGVKSYKFYIPAPEETQKAFKEFYSKQFIKYTAARKHLNFEFEPFVRGCPYNAFNEVEKRGGKWVFGSMGFGNSKGENIWWEWGGDDYFTIKDFQCGKYNTQKEKNNGGIYKAAVKKLGDMRMKIAELSDMIILGE